MRVCVCVCVQLRMPFYARLRWNNKDLCMGLSAPCHAMPQQLTLDEYALIMWNAHHYS